MIENRKILLPLDNPSEPVSCESCAPNVIIGTTQGLKKKTNEDTIGYLKTDKETTRLCLADGHWGEQASRLITNYWIDKKPPFPKIKAEAEKETRNIEGSLHEMFGKTLMDEEKDFTPEASFLVVEISGDRLKIISYGDCRLMVIRNEKIIFKQPTRDTWLGAFSHLGLRNRKSVTEAVIYNDLALLDGDFVCLFTDGVDQCIYEKDTLDLDRISTLITQAPTLQTACANIFNVVFDYGAEDNASLAIFKYGMLY